MSKNPPFCNGEESEVIWNSYSNPDHHQKLITSRGSSLCYVRFRVRQLSCLQNDRHNHHTTRLAEVIIITVKISVVPCGCKLYRHRIIRVALNFSKLCRLSTTLHPTHKPFALLTYHTRLSQAWPQIPPIGINTWLMGNCCCIMSGGSK